MNIKRNLFASTLAAITATGILAGCQLQQSTLQYLSSSESIGTLQSKRIRAVTAESGEHWVLASSERHGVVVFNQQGDQVSRLSLGDVQSFDSRLDASAQGWIVAVDEKSNQLRLAQLDLSAQTFNEINVQQRWNSELTAVCLYQQPDTNQLYSFVATESGLVHQMMLVNTQQNPSWVEVRALAIGPEVAACSVDDKQQQLFIAQLGLGVLALSADEEAEQDRYLLQTQAPQGKLTEAVSDVQWLVEQQALLITEDANNNVWLHSWAQGLQAVDMSIPDVPTLDSDWEITSMSMVSHADKSIWYAVSDEGDRILRFSGGESLMGNNADKADVVTTAHVFPRRETEVVSSYGDAADDPEVWVNQNDPTQSRILATDKQAGLLVYDLQGKQLQFLDRGRVNNVDVRYGVALGDRIVDLAMATNRSTSGVDIYTIDSDTGVVELLSANAVNTDFEDPYGGCLYQSPETGDVYVLVNEKSGRYQQWQLMLEERRTRARLVRSFALEGQPEGCVADDLQQRLYVGQEDYGIWALDAEPDANSDLTLVDNIDSGHVVADIEGLSLYLGEGEEGYLVVSSQGDDSYALYKRSDQTYVGRFRVTANALKGIDGSSETDGLAVTSANLGGEFSRGLLVVQDGRNLMPAQRQNFKLIAWQDIEAALQLEPVQTVSRR